MFTETLLHLHLITKVINMTALYVDKQQKPREGGREISFQIQSEAIKQIDQTAVLPPLLLTASLPPA